MIVCIIKLHYMHYNLKILQLLERVYLFWKYILNLYFYGLYYDIHGLHKSLGTCRAVGQNNFMFWNTVLNTMCRCEDFV